MSDADAPVVMLSGRKFVMACVIVACLLLALGRVVPLPVSLLAAEVFATILGLFIFGSFQVPDSQERVDLRHGARHRGHLLRARDVEWHRQIAETGGWTWMQQHVLSFHGLDDLIHADTMLFILGLTFFVAVIAQTRMLEGVTFFLLRRNGGAILPTVIAVTAVVAFASGILDGVSMIGLTIRTLVIILMLAAAPKEAILQAVMICTTVTTVCGVWLAYGEPPNLIMKANLDPHLGGHVLSSATAVRSPSSPISSSRATCGRQLQGQRINLDTMDVLDANAEDVRFLQAIAARRGADAGRAGRGARAAPRRQGAADRRADCRRAHRSAARSSKRIVPWETRELLLGHYVSEELADSLDRHYVLDATGDDEGAMLAEQWVDDTLAASAQARRRAQLVGALALVPFVVLLIVHGINHDVPLFLASFAGFAVALSASPHPEDARAGAARRAARVRRSTTSCFRCSCRLRC